MHSVHAQMPFWRRTAAANVCMHVPMHPFMWPAEAIDVAFVDRADIKAYIGPPSLGARYDILRSSLGELQRARILAGACMRTAAAIDTLPCLPSPYCVIQLRPSLV